MWCLARCSYGIPLVVCFQIVSGKLLNFAKLRVQWSWTFLQSTCLQRKTAKRQRPGETGMWSVNVHPLFPKQPKSKHGWIKPLPYPKRRPFLQPMLQNDLRNCGVRTLTGANPNTSRQYLPFPRLVSGSKVALPSVEVPEHHESHGLACKLLTYTECRSWATVSALG